MNDEQQQQEFSNFEGFAIVQQMGHKTVSGYVTTQYFGATAFFRVVQQEQPPQEVTLERDGAVNGHYLYAGSKVRISRPRAEQFVAVSSLYAFTPCTEAEANASQPKTVEILERAERKSLTDGKTTRGFAPRETPTDDEEFGRDYGDMDDEPLPRN